MKILERIRNKLVRNWAKFLPKRNRYCVLCDTNLANFLPYRRGKTCITLPRVLHAVGSDIDNFSCPWCGSHDRERHLHLYMKTLGLLDQLKTADVLHFAPEKKLSKLFEKYISGRYVKADLFPATNDIEKVDMTEMSFEDESFDFLIANHVLEHVDNHIKALREIRRVLKKGGYCILQTPYSEKLNKTFSDPGIDNENSRLLAYGQEDHVRLFGKDIFSIISSVGLEPMVKRHADVLSDFEPKHYGVNVEEPLFLFRRPV